ncbi:hypothetical protein M6D93_05050 [Jatrophihabitans telluris]|uniref:IPT/TIG domain-containing protein n=1 Tax=Jatrophihabitans telluris TaxID=2038343 RepID=A0ABY4R0F7_9ACTN|nr:hypothetical protein [Jatrophihabitans telluris]UQX89373.1 hypothetical protein M6D93_05050 [Jatrophihabitans telluris]
MHSFSTPPDVDVRGAFGRTRRRSATLGAVALFAVLATSTGAPASAAPAYPPRESCALAASWIGNSGASAQITGTGFGSDAVVTVTAELRTIGIVHADVSGTFQLREAISAPVTVIRAADRSTACSALLTGGQPSPSPSPAPSGSVTASPSSIVEPPPPPTPLGVAIGQSRGLSTPTLLAIIGLVAAAAVALCAFAIRSGRRAGP